MEEGGDGRGEEGQPKTMRKNTSVFRQPKLPSRHGAHMPSPGLLPVISVDDVPLCTTSWHSFCCTTPVRRPVGGGRGDGATPARLTGSAGFGQMRAGVDPGPDMKRRPIYKIQGGSGRLQELGSENQCLSTFGLVLLGCVIEAYGQSHEMAEAQSARRDRALRGRVHIMCSPS